MSQELAVAQQQLMENLSSLFSDFKSNIRDNITVFLTDISDKWKTIVTKFDEEHKELERIRGELNVKKFEESNFTNVSVIKNQDKQIRENSNRVKELESKIKFLEKENQSLKLSTAKPIVLQPIKLNEIDDADIKDISNIIKIVANDTPISTVDTTESDASEVSSAPVSNVSNDPIVVKKSRITKKESVNASVNASVNTIEIVPNSVDESKSKISRKKPVKTPVNSATVSGETIIEVDEHVNTVAEQQQQQAACKAMREKKEKELRMEQKLIEREAKKLEATLTKEQETDADGNDETDSVNLSILSQDPDDKLLTKPSVEITMPPVIEKKKKTEIKRKDVNDSTKDSTKNIVKDTSSSKAKTNDKKNKKDEPIVKNDENDESEEKDKKDEKDEKDESNDIVVMYPNSIPKSVEDVDTLEYNNEMFYMDINKNVYQMTEDEDIGVFLGVYNPKLNKIMPIKN